MERKEDNADTAQKQPKNQQKCGIKNLFGCLRVGLSDFLMIFGFLENFDFGFSNPKIFKLAKLEILNPKP